MERDVRPRTQTSVKTKLGTRRATKPLSVRYAEVLRLRQIILQVQSEKNIPEIDRHISK
jgi:hypothetical protein